ncbi:MAG: FUSC family protein, partial [Alphaproteobacteria bacterium]
VLVLLAAAVAPYPMLAGLVMFGLIVWLAVPSAVQPPLALRKPFLLGFLVPALSAKLPDGLISATPFAMAGLAAGLVIVLIVNRFAPKAAALPVEGGATVGLDQIAAVVGAMIAATLMWWALSHQGVAASWILIAFVVVFGPEHPDTVARSMTRVAGTLIGAAVVMALTAMPARIEGVIGIVAIILALAFKRGNEFASVIATTVAILSIKGAPRGDFIAWGVERIVDTAIGVALAIAVSSLGDLLRCKSRSL